MKHVPYKRRRGVVELEQPEDLFVIRLDAVGSNGRGVGPVATWNGLTLTPAPAGEVPEDVRITWKAAGWILVRAGVGSTAGLASPELIAPIYRTPDCSWWIGTDRITVRLSEDLTDSDAEELLKTRELRVLRRLGFGKHLYEVRVEAADQTMEAASELDTQPEVEYAEPQFLEQLGPRRRR